MRCFEVNSLGKITIFMRHILLFTLLFISFSTFSQRIKTIEFGRWRGELAMNDRLFVPFFIDFSKENNKPKIEIVNANERIVLKEIKEKNDSVYTQFPELDAILVFKVQESGKEIRGYWLNRNKKVQVKIPFNAYFVGENAKRMEFNQDESGLANKNLTGKWDVTFSPNTKDAEKSVGVFEVTGTKVTGTFLTETGDYRFLEGNISNNEFALSTFNGSWAFYFTGKIDGDKIEGKYYSGVSYSTDWIAVKDENAKLREEQELTFVKNNSDFNFKGFKELNGKPFVFSPKTYANKVVIFQIMGTWCPNCVDEIKFFKELYALYNREGLEILALAYEVGTDQKAQIKRLQAFKKRTGIPYKIVLAGTSNKDVAASHFPMLNGIMSFPTTVFVDQKGKIQRVLTGFSGPATGNTHKQLKTDIQLEVEKLLGLGR